LAVKKKTSEMTMWEWKGRKKVKHPKKRGLKKRSKGGKSPLRMGTSPAKKKGQGHEVELETWQKGEGGMSLVPNYKGGERGRYACS